MVIFGSGNRIKLISGRYLDLTNPRPEQFVLEDIACGLSKICRFGGHIHGWYSVAEHSCHAALALSACDLNTQRAALMHDATEAFIGDVVKPLKTILQPNYGDIEKRLEGIIGEKFSIDFLSAKGMVEKIDHALLLAEKEAMTTKTSNESPWCSDTQAESLKPMVQSVSFMNLWPREAEQLFLQIASKLGLK